MNTSTEQNLVVVSALYKFVQLTDIHALRDAVLDVCSANNIRGTILLAEEGINGTVSGYRESIDQLYAYLNADNRFAGITPKESYVDDFPFHRMKVKLKKEIVTMGVPGTQPGQVTGSRVEAEDWNRLIRDPDVLLIDTRNQYEYEIGTFNGALSPQTETFREFPEFVKQQLATDKNKKIAMFCTGGIRCEKASAYLLENGFSHVYQLNGGILKYLEVMSEDDSEWQGECFVFDGRVAVNHKLEEGSYQQCFACRRPLSDEDIKSEHYSEGVSCHRCYDKNSEAKKSRFSERQKQVELAERRGYQHIGISLHKKQSNTG